MMNIIIKNYKKDFNKVLVQVNTNILKNFLLKLMNMKKFTW